MRCIYVKRAVEGIYTIIQGVRRDGISREGIRREGVRREGITIDMRLTWNSY